ncbi:hypothetical protein GXP70_22935 [Paenibacillus lycopersici]|uniref:CYTH domain-containing protein n=1 Tax=Paenibacillus lycopersici TaxID=2704462 RepID=A0A6C0G2B4_9BACL|nr:hypothetical protein [Paenibacillus lycopersici]QHT62552.1 hypothetical protein GXP70_22935 [Paenibacillus lycopersici]
MDERISFEKHDGIVKLNRAYKGLCKRLDEIERMLMGLGAVLQLSGVHQTDYLFRLPSQLSGEDTRRIKFRLVNGEPFGIYLYDRHSEGSDITFEFIRPADRTLVEALQRSGVPYVCISKIRTRLTFHNLYIHLDQVEGLGDIIEIEAINGESIPDVVMCALAPYLVGKLTGSNEDYFQAIEERKEQGC